MERPPLGGEGYQWDVNPPNWKCFTLCFESREKSYPLNGVALWKRPSLGGEGYQRDGASSDSPILIIFTKLSWLYFKNILF